jgi:hypothetical protein
MKRLIRWKVYDLVKVIVATLLNKFDCFTVIEGGTGTGKSTLAWKIALGVSREFKRLYKLKPDVVEYYYNRIGVQLRLTPQEFLNKIMELKQQKAYFFNPNKVLIYSQDAMQNALASWNIINIPDELINAMFNRDFYGEKQKDIIKMVNMFRDHCNLTIGCVPSFSNIDNQIRGLTKVKITIRKRGLAIVHTPNRVIYAKDKWDQATNEKIEREWIAKKINNPNYSKLTTFRGIMRYPPLTKKEEELYQAIKNKKRNVILKEEMGITIDEEKEKDPVEMITDRLISGGVRNSHVIDGVAYTIGITPQALKEKIRRGLEKQGKATSLAVYYWDKKRSDADEFVGIN